MQSHHSTSDALHQAAGHHAAHEPHELPNIFTFFSQLFPNAVTEFLHQWENIIFSLLAALIISLTAIYAARKGSLIPQGLQNFWESVVEGVTGFVTGILGEQGRAYVPFLGTLFVYILLMNWSGLVPLMKAPTSSWGTTMAVALATVCYVHYHGIRTQGFGHYVKHMAGSPTNAFGFALIPLMLVINLTVEYIAVPLSLSLRLFANISSEDRLLFKFAELNVNFKGLPFFFQLFANVMSIAFSVVQAFVFMLLSTVYISLLLPHEPHGHEEHSSHAAHAH